MKAFILAASLLLFPVGASAQASDEQCLEVATYIFFAASGRDLGAHPQAILDALVGQGVPHDAAMAILEVVFLGMPDRSPDFLATQFFNSCTSEAV